MSEPINPYDSPQTPPPGMSSGAKVLLGLGIGCGVVVLLCCGGGVAAMFFFGRGLQRATSEDPETIRRVTAEIVSIEVPPQLEPQMSLDYSVPFVNRKVMMAIYGQKEDKSMLALFQVDEKFGNPKVMRAQFEQSMEESGRNEWNEVELKEAETLKLEINGTDAEFKVGLGQRNKDDRHVWQATGTFEGKGGPAMLFMQLNAEDFTKEDAMAVLKSMK